MTDLEKRRADALAHTAELLKAEATAERDYNTASWALYKAMYTDTSSGWFAASKWDFKRYAEALKVSAAKVTQAVKAAKYAEAAKFTAEDEASFAPRAFRPLGTDAEMVKAFGVYYAEYREAAEVIDADEVITDFREEFTKAKAKEATQKYNALHAAELKAHTAVNKAAEATKQAKKDAENAVKFAEAAAKAAEDANKAADDKIAEATKAAEAAEELAKVAAEAKDDEAKAKAAEEAAKEAAAKAAEATKAAEELAKAQAAADAADDKAAEANLKAEGASATENAAKAAENRAAKAAAEAKKKVPEPPKPKAKHKKAEVQELLDKVKDDAEVNDADYKAIERILAKYTK